MAKTSACESKSAGPSSSSGKPIPKIKKKKSKGSLVKVVRYAFSELGV